MADYAKRNYNVDEKFLVLPPKFDQESSCIHGFLTLKIGKIVWIKTPGGMEGAKLRLKFWGEEGQGVVLTASNSSAELKEAYANCVTYQIRTSIINFSKYLEDMQQIKIFLLDKRNDKVIGIAHINLLIFMKRNLSEKDSSPIQEIKDIFPILALGNAASRRDFSGNTKLGDIEVEISCLFQSELAPQVKPQQPLTTRASDRKKPKETIDDHLDSSFLMNERRAWESAEKIKENEGFTANIMNNPDDRIANSLRHTHNFNPYTPNPYNPSTSSEDPQPSNSIQPHIRSPQQHNRLPSNTTRETNLSREELRNKPPSSNTQNRLDEVLRRGRLLQEKMNSKEDDLFQMNPKTTGFGLLSAFDNVHQNDEKFNNRLNEYPIERIGDVLIQGSNRKFDPEIEEQRLMFDEVAIMGANARGDGRTNALYEVDTLKVHIGEFDCKNETMLLRMNSKSVFLECEIPNVFPDTLDINTNSLKINSKEMCGNHLFFHHDFFQRLEMNETSHGIWSQSSIVFKLCSYAYADKAPGNNITIELGKGDIKLSNLIKTQSLSGNFVLSMFSKAPVDIPEKPDGKKPVKLDKTGIKVIKRESALKKVEGEVYIGDLNIGLSLLSISKRENRKPSPPKQDLSLENNTKRRVELEGNQTTNFSTLNFQMLLFIEKTVNIQAPVNRTRNIFIRYKVYGTTEVIETPVNWGESNPKFGHKMILPLSFELIQKTQKVPFMIEVWDKTQKDNELLGLVRLNLAPVCDMLFDESSGLLNVGLIKNNIHPIIIHDGLSPISDLKSGKNVGLLQVLVAFGTVSQIHKFEIRMQGDTTPQENTVKCIVPKSPVKGDVEDRGRGLSNDKDLRRTNEYLSNSQRKPDKTQRDTFDDLKLNDKEDNPFNLSTKTILIQIFEQIRKDSNKHVGTLRNYLQIFDHQRRDPSIREFNTFLKSLEFSEAVSLAAVGILDYKQRGTVLNSHFLGSFNAFKILQDEIRSKFANNLYELRGGLNKKEIKPRDLERRLTERSEFGYLRRQQFIDVLRELNAGISVNVITKIADYLDFCDDEYIYASELIDALRSLDVYEDFNFIKINISQLAEAVNARLSNFLLNGGVQLDSLFHKQELFNKNLELEEIIQVLNNIGFRVTFIEVLLLIDLIKKRYLITGLQDWEVSYTHFYDFLAFTLNRARAEEELTRRQEDDHRKPAGYVKERREEESSSQQESMEDVLDIANILNDRGNRIEKPPICDKNPLKENKEVVNVRGDVASSVINQKPETKPPNRDHEENKEKGKFLKHSFEVQIHNAKDIQNIGLLKEGSYSFKYTFPLNDDVIESTPFDYESSRTKYLIDYKSKHKLSLGREENIKQVLKSSNKGILIKMCRREQYFDQPIAYCLIPTEDIIEIIKLPEDSSRCKKTYILYCIDSGLAQKAADVEPIIGKLSIVLRYSKSEVENNDGSELKGAETLMEKETQILRMLPKQGILGIDLLGISNFKRALVSLTTNERLNSPNADFFTTVYCSCFAGSEELAQLFPPFETEPVYNLFEYQNFHLEKYDVNLTEEIINYFKDGSLYLELRLYKTDDAEYEEEGKTYSKVAHLNLPLLQLIINPDGIKGEFELLNTRGGKVCNLCMNVTFQKESKSGHLGKPDDRCKNTKILLGMYEILNYNAKEEFSERLRFLSEKKEDLLIYFTFRAGGTVHKSNTYKCHSASKLLSIDDCSFCFDLNDLEKEERDCLEIKLFTKSRTELDDIVYGYVNIDLKQIKSRIDPRGFSNSSFYYTVFGNPAGSKLVCQRIRLGIKLLTFNTDVLENPALFSELSSVFDRRSLRTVEETLRGNEHLTTKSYFDTIKQTGKKLTAYQLENFAKFFPRLNPEEAHRIFSPKICPHLDFQAEPVKKSVLEEILNDFSFFDFENTGFIELESAIRALLPYESHFKLINKELLKKFTPSGAELIPDLNIGLISVKDKFDYVVFMRKVTYLENIPTETLSQQFDKIYNNSKKIDDFYARRLDRTTREEGDFIPSKPEEENSFLLSIEIVSGHSMQHLTENGLPPNCFVALENKVCAMQTEISYRVANPIWNTKKSFKIEGRNVEMIKEIEAKIMQRSYNNTTGKSIYNDSLIGRTIFNIEKILNNKKIVNQLLEGNVKPALKKPDGKSEPASILLKFNVEEARATPRKIRNTGNYKAEDEDLDQGKGQNDLSQDLIENFHKTLDEVYKDVQAEKEKSDKKLRKRLDSFEREFSAEKVNEREDSERSSRKQDMKQTLADLDNLTINLNKMLNEGPSSNNKRLEAADSNSKQPREGVNPNKDNFSFGKLNEEDQGWKTSSFSDATSKRKLDFTDGSDQASKKQDHLGNPFENYLDKTVPNQQRGIRQTSDSEDNRKSGGSRRSSAKGKDSEAGKENERLGEKEEEKNIINSEKPPIKRNSSLTRIKKMEEKLNISVKDSKELERISKIMKQDFSKSKNMYNFSSDSDS